jgi:hypothetical protein
VIAFSSIESESGVEIMDTHPDNPDNPDGTDKTDSTRPPATYALPESYEESSFANSVTRRTNRGAHKAFAVGLALVVGALAGLGIPHVVSPQVAASPGTSTGSSGSTSSTSTSSGSVQSPSTSTSHAVTVSSGS